MFNCCLNSLKILYQDVSTARIWSPCLYLSCCQGRTSATANLVNAKFAWASSLFNLQMRFHLVATHPRVQFLWVLSLRKLLSLMLMVAKLVHLGHIVDSEDDRDSDNFVDSGILEMTSPEVVEGEIIAKLASASGSISTKIQGHMPMGLGLWRFCYARVYRMSPASGSQPSTLGRGRGVVTSDFGRGRSIVSIDEDVKSFGDQRSNSLSTADMAAWFADQNQQLNPSMNRNPIIRVSEIVIVLQAGEKNNDNSLAAISNSSNIDGDAVLELGMIHRSSSHNDNSFPDRQNLPRNHGLNREPNIRVSDPVLSTEPRGADDAGIRVVNPKNDIVPSVLNTVADASKERAHDNDDVQCVRAAAVASSGVAVKNKNSGINAGSRGLFRQRRLVW
ncbi:hypothetical protein NE237_007720 [Protea cynaroides]|uniref:Uncharacterized protein n=1 Tax=Protea cynaroides TaxID=273540 RepID=A0A9Q0KPY8_9MAGN|nr:hypothetical protein NE237_007720 [Protea cynaroides]